jgi:hypothetical protein
MASRRDYSEEYQRRQERAQAEGFASDYERRMAQAPSGEAYGDQERREFLRGHRGESFLRDYAREGDAVEIGSDRDSQGRFTSLTYYPTDPDREVRQISIRGMDTDEIRDLLDDLEDEGVAVSAGYLEE